MEGMVVARVCRGGTAVAWFGRVIVYSYLVGVLNAHLIESYRQALFYPMVDGLVKKLPPGMCQGCKNRRHALAQ